MESSDATLLGERPVSIWQVAVAVAAAGLLGAFAFAYLFTSFGSWDDEGYFLQAYREFLSGRVLFNQVFSLYGPLTFFLAAVFALLNPANITHDALRWITFPAWLLIASLLAGVVWRWTHRFAPSVAIFLMVGFRLNGLAWGVGHPQLWIILATAVLVSLGLDWIPDAAQERRAFWAGVSIGAILLLKINIGILVFVGFAFAVSLHFKPRLRLWTCGLLILPAGAVGMALLFAGSAASEKLLALAYLGSLAVTVGIATKRPVDPPPSLRSLAWIAAGLVACISMGIAGTLALGTTPRALYDTYVTLPALLVNSYHNPFTDATQPLGIALSLTALCLTLGILWRRRRMELPGAWLGLIKMAVGIGLLYAFSYDHRMTLVGSLLMMWLLIADVPESGPAFSNRLLLALLSPLFSLQLFPMAGSQVDWAVLLPITAAGVLVADGMNFVERQRGRVALPRFVRGTLGTLLTLLTMFLFLLVGVNAVERVNKWRELQPLNLPGAHWLRLESPEATRLKSTVTALKENCKTVLMIPGLYSFSIWSDVAPFEDRRINSWPFLWPDEVQKKELRTLRGQAQGCVLVSQEVYQFFKQFAVSPGHDELTSEIQRTMRPIYQVQDVTLYQFPPVDAGEPVSEQK